jgi:hypothetical protein
MRKKPKATPKAAEKAPGGQPTVVDLVRQLVPPRSGVSAAPTVTVTRRELEQTHEAWFLLWRGTLALLETQAPGAYLLLLEKLRRHGGIATSFSVVGNPSTRDGKLALSLRDHERPEPIPEIPRPPSAETLTRLRAFAEDRKPVQRGRPRDTTSLSIYYLFDWAKRHLPPLPKGAPRQRLDDRALEWIRDNFNPTRAVGTLENLVQRGRRLAQRGHNPLDAVLRGTIEP